jgi:hypothetical protein
MAIAGNLMVLLLIMKRVQFGSIPEIEFLKK